MLVRAPKKVILLSVASIAVVIIGAVGTWLALTATTKTPTTDLVTEHDIHMFAEHVKSATTYRSLPESKQQEFLEDESVKLGLDIRQEITPETVTIQCIDIHNTQLYQMARRHKDEIKQYQTALNHALMQIRDACYANYDPDGRILPEEMPKMQQH